MSERFYNNYGFLLTREQTHELLQSVYTACFPPGEPGVVPTEPGDYYASIPGDTKQIEMVLVEIPNGKRAWDMLQGPPDPGTPEEMTEQAIEHGFVFQERWKPAPQ